jgi:hypothetical protein
MGLVGGEMMSIEQAADHTWPAAIPIEIARSERRR